MVTSQNLDSVLWAFTYLDLIEDSSWQDINDAVCKFQKSYDDKEAHLLQYASEIVLAVGRYRYMSDNKKSIEFSFYQTCVVY